MLRITRNIIQIRLDIRHHHMPSRLQLLLIMRTQRVHVNAHDFGNRLLAQTQTSRIHHTLPTLGRRDMRTSPNGLAAIRQHRPKWRHRILRAILTASRKLNYLTPSGQLLRTIINRISALR